MMDYELTRSSNIAQPLMLTLCLQEESLLVSNAVLEALGRPQQVQLLINDEKCMLLLQPCTIADREAVIIPQQPMMQFEMSGASLLKRVRKLTGWNDNHPRVIYGDYIPQHHAILFDLRQAKLAQLQMPE